jgi:hypothetical protein
MPAANGGRPAIRQRYEEPAKRRGRPADPTNPGDAADLSIMGQPCADKDKAEEIFAPLQPWPA